VFSFMAFTLSPNKLISIPNRLHFLGLSWWHILKQNWKAMAIEHLLVSAHSE
jgi:hypothetical protein